MADSWITNKPVGAGLGISPTAIRDWMRTPPADMSAPAVGTLSPGLQEVMRQRGEIIGQPTAPVVMPAPVRPVDQQPAVQFRERGKSSGNLPMPSTPMTMGQALKFLALTKPLTPVEQAQTALLGRAFQQQGQIKEHLDALDPKKVTQEMMAKERLDADQRNRNNLLDVLGLGTFQNVMAGQMAGLGVK